MITEEKAKEMLIYYLEEWKRLSEIANNTGEQKDHLIAREAIGCYCTMRKVLEM